MTQPSEPYKADGVCIVGGPVCIICRDEADARIWAHELNSAHAACEAKYKPLVEAAENATRQTTLLCAGSPIDKLWKALSKLEPARD